MGPVGTWHFEDVFFLGLAKNICHMNLIFSSVWEGTFFESHAFCVYLSISQRPVERRPSTLKFRHFGSKFGSHVDKFGSWRLGLVTRWKVDARWAPTSYTWSHDPCNWPMGSWGYDPLKWRYIPTCNWVGATFVKIDKFSRWFGVPMHSNRSFPKHWMVTKENFDDSFCCHPSWSDTLGTGMTIPCIAASRFTDTLYCLSMDFDVHFLGNPSCTCESHEISRNAPRRIDRIAIPSHQLWSATTRVTSPSLSTKVILPSSFTMKVLRTTITSSGEDCRSELCHLVDLISFDIAGYSFNQWMMGAWWLVVYYTPEV